MGSGITDLLIDLVKNICVMYGEYPGRKSMSGCIPIALFLKPLRLKSDFTLSP